METLTVKLFFNRPAALILLLSLLVEKVKGRAVKKLCQKKSRWKIKIEVVQET